MIAKLRKVADTQFQAVLHEHFAPVTRRDLTGLMRVRAGLQAARGRRTIGWAHYPP